MFAGVGDILEQRIDELVEENKQLRELVFKLGDRLVSQGEKFAMLAEKKIIKVDRTKK